MTGTKIPPTEQTIPHWLRDAFGPQIHARILNTLASVESRTTAEIVPIIVRQSSATGHVFWLVWLLLALLCAALERVLEQSALHWGVDLAVFLVLGWIIAYPIARALSRLDWVKRLLTPDLDEINQVHARAELEFYRHGLTQTQGRTGVLLLISWMEHRAVILADKAVSQEIPQSEWDQLIQTLLQGAKQKNWEQSLDSTLQELGQLLARKLPRQSTSSPSDALSNRLVIIE